VFSYFIQYNRFMGFFGIIAILGVAFLFSKNKRKIKLRLIGSALAMQFALAFFILKTSLGRHIFSALSRMFQRLYQFADQGSEFLFGKLIDPSGSWGAIFALKLVPMIIFFAALISVLFHLGIIQFCVKIISFLIRPILGTSGAETLCAASNSMLGQTEAPFLIKRYLQKMTPSEILVVMVSGMATLSGSIMAVYGMMGIPMTYLLSAGVMAVPGSILIAKILYPEDGKPETLGGKQVALKSDSKSILDAISSGTTDGLKLAVNVAAMLIAFISLIALADFILGRLTGYTFGVTYTLNAVFAKLFSWVAFLLGVAKEDYANAGSLIGTKLVINEFVAYANSLTMELTVRSRAILTYVLAGFANFSSIGIQIGGIGALVPEKRPVLVKLGLYALLGGTLANLLNAAIAGLFI
jgi:concentrative nucleoside transporter, CNT family